ncbi:hypothetical protein RDI58_027078 [Solanum bulbocastanum]|uniref:Uncharacterized protein n=1 Tax=Solanum bulbocastanum TaxID=147425 RepID=A0AAN8SXJ1_SOLBU
MNGQAPPFSIRDYLNTNMSPPIQVSTSNPVYPPGFCPYANTCNAAGTSTVCPLSMPVMSNSLFMPTAPTNTVPQPIMEPKSNNDPPPKVQYDRGYTLELTFKISSSYPYTHQYNSHVEAKEVVKNEQHEEITRKMKSLEHIFQYNIDIVLDCTSLTNMRKKTTKNFREYAIRWREQAAWVKPPMKESEMIHVFLQAQEPT